MTIFRDNMLNTTALSTADLYIRVVTPTVRNLNGVPTNVGAFVGVASWGPTNKPIDISDLSDGTPLIGDVMDRKYDLATAIMVAAKQGNAGVYKCVRVTDGTDVKATVVRPATGTVAITYTAKYSGIRGNGITVSYSPGTKPNTTRVTVSAKGYLPESFNNIAGAGATLWANIADAINKGLGSLSGASQLITAAAGTATTAIDYTASDVLAGGTDGAGSVTDAIVMGTDGALGARTGMYALRSSGASLLALLDVVDDTTFPNQVAFAISEGMYVSMVKAAGTTINDAISTRSTRGLDDTAFVLHAGDWPIIEDEINGYPRTVSPQAFKIGVLANLSPDESSLNKPLQGVINTQRNAAGLPYSSAELQLATVNNIELLTNPIPAGNVFGFRVGRNGSSNEAVHGDNYTRMTNYLAATFNKGMGYVIGKKNTPTLRADTEAVFDAFLSNMTNQEMIKDFETFFDPKVNTPTFEAAGNLQIAVRVRYLAIIEHFIVALEGGQNVKITRSSYQAAA